MAFVDEITLHLKAGCGGDGVVRWRHEKGIEKGGPWGGNGGKGGDIYAVGSRDIGLLAKYKNVKSFEAGNGENGAGALKQGKEGKGIELKAPLGSKITNLESGHVIEILKDEEKIRLLKGGRGGLGNNHFKGSTNQNPMKATKGEVGEEADFLIELLLIVDIGIIGLPNTGKSSLLNTLTSAKSKVGNFPFTTLEPSLGSFYGLIIADIPGLIEGAHEGKGLGHKFLRHIERTKRLIHCISAEETDPLKAYEIVRRELELYNKEIIKKPEMVLLTKVDLIGEKERRAKLKFLKKVSKDVSEISIIDDALLENLKHQINESR